MVINFLTMYNARYISKIYTNHLFKQIIWYSISILIILKFNKHSFLFKHFKILYWFNILLLILVLFIGKEINGAKAWFDFKFFSFQPSELMKFTYTLYLTNLIQKYKFKNLKTDFIFLCKIFIILLIPSIVIFLEPDTGAIIFLLVITICMLLLSNIKKIWFIVISLIILLFVFLFFYLYFFKQDLLINLIGI